MTSAGQTVSGLGSLSTGGTDGTQVSTSAPLAAPGSETLVATRPTTDRSQGQRNRRVPTQAGANLQSLSENDVMSEPMDDQLMERYRRLKELMIRDQRRTHFGNAGLETGRPDMIPMEHLRPDSTDIFSMPSVDTLMHRRWRPSGNDVATGEQIIKIAALLQGLGVPEDQIATVAWDISMYCTATGASPFMNPSGTIQLAGGAVPRDAVVAAIKKYTTLRQFCRKYAPTVFQYMKLHDEPPANWQAKGFTEETKYAAFDFFDYVTNPACVQPLEGLIVQPTPAECIAYNTKKKECLAKRANNDRFASYSAEVTGGKFGCPVNAKWRESNCN